MVEEKVQFIEDGNCSCDSKRLRIRSNRDVTLRLLVSTTSIRYVEETLIDLFVSAHLIYSHLSRKRALSQKRFIEIFFLLSIPGINGNNPITTG